MLENTIVHEITRLPGDGLTGRRKIKTPVKEITAENVKDVLSNALAIHYQNAAEISYLWDYYRGKQDIRLKEKYARENINNKVVVNRASEIVSFKSSFLLEEPIQYISNGGNNDVSNSVNRLNEYMRAESKAAKDKEIADWIHICGVAERLVLPDYMVGTQYGAPFALYTIDPRKAFVIYSARIGEKPMAGVVLQVDENNERFATVYTENRVFTVKGETVTEDGVLETADGQKYGHIMGGVPLVEYVNNEARMGAFEPVISILNNINLLESNAVDSVQDFVNGFDVFQNCEIEDGTYGQLSIGGQAVKIKTVVQGMEAKVYRVASELSQSGVQERIDDLTDAYLEICGMPNRNGGSSTSDTGAAVLYRDGHVSAFSRAKDTATLWERSEREMDNIVINICDARAGSELNLTLADFKTKFPLDNLQNNQSLTQTFIELLNNPKVHPKVAYDVGSALFKDSEEAYRLGMEYYKAYEDEQEAKLDAELDRERERINNANATTVQAGRQSDSATEQGGASES